MVVTEYGEYNPQYWGKPQSIGLLGLSMATTWVVDSNCFIHMGSMAQDNLIEDLRKSIPEGIFVTPGVHKEVRTVRFQRWKNKPNLLEKMKPILTTIAVDDDQIKGLASQIGERAAPQDVDLSLMVLASKLSREGRDVTLVTDDFKMTTTSQKVNLDSIPVHHQHSCKDSLRLVLMPANQDLEVSQEELERRKCAMR